MAVSDQAEILAMGGVIRIARFTAPEDATAEQVESGIIFWPYELDFLGKLGLVCPNVQCRKFVALSDVQRQELPANIYGIAEAQMRCPYCNADMTTSTLTHDLNEAIEQAIADMAAGKWPSLANWKRMLSLNETPYPPFNKLREREDD